MHAKLSASRGNSIDDCPWFKWAGEMLILGIILKRYLILVGQSIVFLQVTHVQRRMLRSGKRRERKKREREFVWLSLIII